MSYKRLLCPERLRQTPTQFSWIDQRLVRDRHIMKISHPEQGLYLFLTTVADAQGLSYYSDRTVAELLRMPPEILIRARRGLMEHGLIAYQKPFYQVLSLEGAGLPVLPTASPRSSNGPQRIGDLFRQL